MTPEDHARPAPSLPPSRLAGFHLEKVDLWRLGCVAAIIGCLYFLYQFFGVTDLGYDIHRTTRSMFSWIYDRWKNDWRETNFAHSHLVPFISLLLVWLDRRALAALPKRASATGFLIVALALVLHWAGAKSEQTRISVMSLIGLSWGIPFFICGWPTAKRLIFPCSFLVFSIPLNFFDSLAYPLRLLSASLTAGLLSGLGIDVAKVGSAIISNTNSGIKVELADSCSGIFAVTGAVAFSYLCAGFVQTRWSMRLLLIAASIPLLVAANILRGMIGFLAGEYFGETAGAWALSHLSGPIICLVAFGGLCLLTWLVRNKEPAPAINRNTTSTGSSPVFKPAAWVATMTMILLATWLIPRNLYIDYMKESGLNLELPATIGTWKGGRLLFCYRQHENNQLVNPSLSPGDPCPVCGDPLHEMSATERRLLPEDTVLRKNMYDNTEQKRRVYFTMVLSGRYRASIHRPEVCLVGPNSEIARSYIHPVKLADGRTLDVKILEMIQRGALPDGTIAVNTSYYAYWFTGNGRETPSHLQRMLWMASDRLFHNMNYGWAYISLAGYRAPNQTTYLAEVEDFLRDAYPYLIKRGNGDKASEPIKP